MVLEVLVLFEQKPIVLNNYLLNIAPNLYFRISRSDSNSYYIDSWHEKGLFISLLHTLHLNLSSKLFMDLISSDYLTHKYRFTNIYYLLSIQTSNRFFLRYLVPRSQIMYSITSVYKNAGWYERESYDLFGICYLGCDDLRRILNDYGFNGFPLRKDFPLSGFTELKYDSSSRTIRYEPISLVQEYRYFKTKSPWSYFV